MSICIFACDHRDVAEYNLPFIRIGNSPAGLISFDNDEELSLLGDVLSENARIWYVFKHLNELGSLDYIGFCHYRRFFSKYPARLIVVEYSGNDFLNYVLTPDEQLNILKQTNADGILEFEFNDSLNKFNDLLSVFKFLNIRDGHNIPEQLIDFAKDVVIDSIPKLMREYAENAFKHIPVYHSNIFTVKREVFIEYETIVVSCIKKILKKI